MIAAEKGCIRLLVPALIVLALVALPAAASIPEQLARPDIERGAMESLAPLVDEVLTDPPSLVLEGYRAREGLDENPLDDLVVREDLLSAAELPAPEKPHLGVIDFLLDAHQALEVCNSMGPPGLELAWLGDRVGVTYSGHYFDREANLYSTPSRYYDPETGRFISQDGIEYGHVDDPPSLHRYFYAHANPLRYVDLDGHEPGKVTAWQWAKRTTEDLANIYVDFNIGVDTTVAKGVVNIGTLGVYGGIQQARERGELFKGGAIVGTMDAAAHGMSDLFTLGAVSHFEEGGTGLGFVAKRTGYTNVTTGYSEIANAQTVEQAVEGSGHMLEGFGEAASVALGVKAATDTGFALVARSSRAAIVEEASGMSVRDRVLQNIEKSKAGRTESAAAGFKEQALREEGIATLKETGFIKKIGESHEMRMNARIRAQGETVIDTKYGGNNGFDSVSFSGDGANAKLFINEAKAGGAPRSSFTTFGLGSKGAATFNKALQVAEDRILSAGLDKATTDALIQQLRGNTAEIRIFGGPRTTVGQGVVKDITDATGLTTRVMPAVR